MDTTPHVGQIVTGTRLGGGPNARRLTVKVTHVEDDLYVMGLWAYASTFTEGGTYQDSYRGTVVLDPTTVVAK